MNENDQMRVIDCIKNSLDANEVKSNKRMMNAVI